MSEDVPPVGIRPPPEIAGFVDKHYTWDTGWQHVAGPGYSIDLINSFAEITFAKDRGRDDETVIACAPETLPAGYAARRNCEGCWPNGMR